MEDGKRRREVSSCIPCYTRKQKCDRKYPCNRCSRRRQPELCAYYHSQSQQSQSQSQLHTQLPNLPVPTERSRSQAMQPGGNHWEHEDNPSDSSPSQCTSGTPHTTRDSSSLAEVFGYYGHSGFNTMALVRKLVPDDDSPNAKDMVVSDETMAEAKTVLDKMLGRPILDFLVGYFVAKVNWIDQLIYPPWFLGQYQRWWNLDKLSSVSDIEFPILFLRICCYATQFLPSPTYTIDSIKGVSLADIRKSCEEASQALAPICIRLDPRGSLIRVQHIAFSGLASVSVSRMNAFWESLSCATRVAQQIGLHLGTVAWPGNMDELEKEMKRQTYCNLYIWDSCLSKRLDRVPFLPDSLSDDIMPQMNLLPDIDLGADAPGIFTERVLQAQLAQFWRSHSSAKGSEYDPITAEERYDTFCATFLSTIPPVFSLQPDKQWDERIPALPMQRQLLHVAIFEYICWNFRPTLLQKPENVKILPAYKQILLLHSNRALAAAALGLLEAVSTLHMMMGGSHTRFAGIIVPIFEASVPLLCLCADKSFPGDTIDGRLHSIKTDPLGVGRNTVTRTECIQAARNALNCLQTLAEVSSMAEAGAQTLARLIDIVDNSKPITQAYEGLNGPADKVIQAPEAWSCDQIGEYSMRESQADIFGNMELTEINPDWEAVLRDLTGNFESGEIGAGSMDEWG